MKEKVMFPEGAEATRGKIAEVTSVATPIPPEPLIGGTEPYQKDNGTGYWYCKIKDSRDEFMYLYFGDLTENDVLYDVNGKEREFVGERQLGFKENAVKALSNKPKESFRWIPVYEPSLATDGGIQYVAGEKVLRGPRHYQWEEIFKKYSPENGSQQSYKTTYFLLGLRWLKDGITTVNELANNSVMIGHYRNSLKAKADFERTGEREFGGLCGFVGNTYKEVKDPEAIMGISLLGGECDQEGDESPFANVRYCCDLGKSDYYGTGLIELTGATRHC